MAGKNTTIRDVANEAHVSTATVSRVIRNLDSVRPQMRERVMRAIAKVGYVENLGARSLRTGRTHTLAHVLPRSYPIPFYAALNNHLIQTTSSQGYCLTDYLTESNPEKERAHFEALTRQRVEGVFISGLTDPDNLSILNQAGLAYCLIERPSDRIRETGGVLIDHEHGVEKAVQHLLDLGHQRIAFIGVHPNRSVESERLEGYRAAMKKAGLSVDDRLVFLGDNYTVNTGRLLARTLLTMDLNPTAAFITSDMMTIGVLQELYVRGVHIPEDMSVVNFEDSWGEYTIPPLTCIHMPTEEVAQAAFTLLTEHDGGGSVRNTHVVQPCLTIRESTRRMDTTPPSS